MVAEAVSGVCDRVLPFAVADHMSEVYNSRATMDAVLGLADNVFPPADTNFVSTFNDTDGASGSAAYPYVLE